MYICLKYCAAWAHNIGYGLALASILQIPFWFLVQIILKVRGHLIKKPQCNHFDLDLIEYYCALFFLYNACVSFMNDKHTISAS